MSERIVIQKHSDDLPGVYTERESWYPEFINFIDRLWELFDYDPHSVEYINMMEEVVDKALEVCESAMNHWR